MHKRLFIYPLLLLSVAHARQIDVSDHGIFPGEDVTLKVNALIESISGEKPVTIVFPKGKYDFFPENAVERYRAVANHDNGLKRMGFPLFGHQNLTIDGNGSVFMFHGRLIPFTLDEVNEVHLRNFTIDFIRPFHAELTVVERNEETSSVVVETDLQKYPYTFIDEKVYFDRLGQKDELVGSNIIFDPSTEAPIYMASKYAMRKHGVQVEPEGKGRIRLNNAFDHLPPLESVLIVYGKNPTSRLCHAIQITNSKDIFIENVTVHAAGGMGLIVERTENVKLSRMTVTAGPNRLVSTRADATHFIGCKGLIEVENCLFEHMLDDSINVHGAYVPIVEHLQGNSFLCEISHFQQWGLTFAEPGDRIALLSRKTILPFFRTTITEIHKLNERRFIVTLKELPSELPEGLLSMENLTWNPDLIMRNSIVRKNRARSMLISTKGNVLIENNYFSSQMHGILIEGDNNFWYESGGVENVLIQNNIFENIGFGIARGYPLIASPKLTANQHLGEGYYHRNIRFSNNRIRSFNGRILKALSVEHLVFENNRIEHSSDYPMTQSPVAIQLDYCHKVEVKENQVTGFKDHLWMNPSADCSEVSFTNNQNLSILQ
jgi:hypothetical protein